MSTPRDVIWADDHIWKNKWQGESGLIIGSGRTRDYQCHVPYAQMLESFAGRIIGCNEAFTVIHPERLDLVCWIDNIVWTNPIWKEKFFQLRCPLMVIDPADWKGDYFGRPILGLRAIPPPDRFSESFDQGFCPCNDTGYLAVQLGFILGLKTIYLRGFDAWEGLYNQKSNHFGVASEWAKKNGRELYVTDKNSFLCHEDENHKKLVEFKPLPNIGEK